MTQSSAEGVIASLDARLRPDGEKGPLVVPLAAFESYYRERAQLWEIHALSRARPVSGPLQDAYIHIARKTWRDIGQQSDLFVKIDNMLERIQRERSSGDEFLDFKTGAGGMIKRWVELKIRRHLMRARKRGGFGWKRWSTRWLYANLGLFNGYRVRRAMPKVSPA